MNYFSFGLTLLALGLAAPHAVAQEATGNEEPLRPTSLINLDSTELLKRGQISGQLDLRAFGGGEGLTYTSLGVHVGLGHHWEAAIRGSFADMSNFSLPDTGASHLSDTIFSGGGAVRHGGTDVEVLARYRFLRGEETGFKPSVTGLIGLGFPNTPDRTAASLTLGLSASAPLKHWATFTLNPRAVVLDDRALIGIGLGAQFRLAKHISLIGDYTPILSGNNTRNTIDGSLMRRDVYGAAIRFSVPKNDLSLDLGYTNGLGSTTGYSLTPGLDGSGAFYFAITARH